MNLHWFRVLLLCALSALGLRADLIDLGTAASYSVLGGSAVTNTGPTIVSGDLGVSPGSAITGFPPGLVLGTTHAGDAAAAQAQADALVAFNALAAYAATVDLTGQDLGGLTLTPGVYSFDSSAQLTGTLTLDLLGDVNSLFIFQIGSTLTTASGASVITVNGVSGDNCCNVFWQVGSSATLGTTTDFRGNILALTSITLNTDAAITDGRALALTGAVTLDTNRLTSVVCDNLNGPTEIPEPRSFLSLGGGLFAVVLLGLKSRRRRS